MNQRSLQREDREHTPNKKQYKIFATNQKLDKLAQNFNFNKEELEQIKQRFDKYAEHGILNKKNFRKMVGILGCEEAPFLSDKIFSVIDKNSCGMVNLENFIEYLHIMINESEVQKAKLSFKFIDQGNKKYIDHWDIEKLVQQVSALWKHLSGSKVIPQKHYIDKIINMIDTKHTGKVTFTDYLEAYQKNGNQFDWFQYFNQDEFSYDDENSKQNLLNIELEKKNQIQSIRQLILQIEDDIQVLVIKIKESERAQNQLLSKIQSPTKMQSPLNIQGNIISPVKRQQKNNQVLIISNHNPNVNGGSVQIIKPNQYQQQQQYQYQQMQNGSNQFYETQFLSDFDNSQIVGNEQIQMNYASPTSIKDQFSQSGPLFVNLQTERNDGDVGLKYGGYEGMCLPETDDDDDFSKTRDQTENIESQRSHQHSSSHKSQQQYQQQMNSNNNNNSMFQDAITSNYEQKTQLLALLEEKLQQIKTLAIKAEDVLNKPLSFQGEYNVKKNSVSINRERLDDPFNVYRETFNSQQKSIEESLFDDSQANQKQIYMRKTTIKNMATKVTNQKENLQIYFGHENWNIILNLMIGIRSSLKKLFVNLEYQPTIDDYKSSQKHDLIQLITGQQEIKKSYYLMDYATVIFEHIRSIYNINRENYLRSVGPEKLLGNLIMGRMNSLTELCRCSSKTKGTKTNSFQYFTEDGQYTAVTISKEQMKVWRFLIKPYHEYLIDNKHSFLCRTFGLHKLYIQSQKETRKLRFMFVGNVFPTLLEIDERYELKGSTHKRTVLKNGKYKQKSTAPLKDQDLINKQVKMNISDSTREKIIQQLEKDVNFLKQHKIFNYRLLVGIHEVRQNLMSQIKQKSQFKKFDNELETHWEGIQSQDGKYIYFLGIINYFTQFTTGSSVINSVKSTMVGGNISTVPPDQYGDRFIKFIDNHLML